MLLVAFLLVHYIVLTFAAVETRVVNLSYGSIRGKLVTTRKGQQGYAFLAIPMTEPPIGSLRFKKAVPIKPWNGTVDCLNYKFACPQLDKKIHNPFVTKSEDCLQNNVFTSRTCLEKGGCPVIVFIHGGARLFITPARTKEEHLIQNFANELILAPHSHGLFQQAVAMSTGFSGERNDKICTKYSQKFAKRINCATEDEKFVDLPKIEKILKCLRAKPWEELYAVQDSFQNDVEQLDGTWIDGPGGVFSANYAELLKQKLPPMKFMLGTTTAESKSTRVLIDPTGKVNSSRLDDICTGLAYENNYESPEGFRKICKERYGTVKKAADLSDDVAYYQPSSVFVNKFSQSGDVFVYSFDYNYTGPKFTWDSPIVSPMHADDLKYFMWGNYDEFTEKDWEIQAIYSGFFVNFVKYGNPSYRRQEWKPWKRRERNYFLIGRFFYIGIYIARNFQSE